MAVILYKEVDDFLRREERYKLLENAKGIKDTEWNTIVPDSKHNWLTAGLDNDFEKLLPIDGKNNIYGIFIAHSRGALSNGDFYIYNSDKKSLLEIYKIMVQNYQDNYYKWLAAERPKDVESVIQVDESKLKWVRYTKKSLARGKQAKFDSNNIRTSIYRPFYSQYYNSYRLFNEEVYQFPKIFPTPETENENRVICVSGVGSSKPFHCLMVKYIPCLDMLEKTQCFPFYIYDEDGTNRRENLTDWGLKQFQEHYRDSVIDKWDIFYYIYGVLHKAEYRSKYGANLRLSLPRIPLYENFWKYSEAGRQLAELHINYDNQPEYFLQKFESPDKQLNWKVEKMKLSKDKQSIVYNEFLILYGIPHETFEYRLGYRSALEWIIDQYQIKKDKRSGIINDPNKINEPDYIIRLIGKIITVSLETVKITREL